MWPPQGRSQEHVEGALKTLAVEGAQIRTSLSHSFTDSCMQDAVWRPHVMGCARNEAGDRVCVMLIGAVGLCCFGFGLHELNWKAHTLKSTRDCQPKRQELRHARTHHDFFRLGATCHIRKMPSCGPYSHIELLIHEVDELELAGRSALAVVQ